MDSIFVIVGNFSEQAEYERLLAILLQGYSVTKRWQVSSAHKFVLCCYYKKASLENNTSTLVSKNELSTSAEGDNIKPNVIAVARIDNKAALLQDRGIDKSSTLGDADFLQACYSYFGANFCQKLEGDFCYALWDDDQSQLHLARNTFNTRSLYYLPLKGALFIACDAKILSRHPDISVTVNKTAVLQWLRKVAASFAKAQKPLAKAHVHISTKLREDATALQLQFAADGVCTT